MVYRLRKILGLFVLILLIANLVYLTSSASTSNVPLFSFSGFLEISQNAPTTSPIFQYSIPNILGDWGIFNFLRDFINGLSSIMNFFLVITNSLWELLNQVIYYCSVIF